MKSLRIFLLILIVLGVGLLATRAHWVPPLVNEILSHEQSPLILGTSTTTPATKPASVTNPPAPVSSGVDGTVTIGPTCPVMRNDQDCADKPYETTLVLASTVIGRNGDVLIKSDAQGHFSHNLSPGTYTLRAQSDNFLPRLQPVTFTVEENKRTQLLLQFDSGIR